MQSNITNNDLGIGFLGTIEMDGVPAHVQGGVYPGRLQPGIISDDNTETAYFGRIVSVDPDDDKKLIVGWRKGLIVRGILINRQGIRENEPAKPNYILNGQPAEFLYKGPAWHRTWDTVVGKTPAVGDMIVFKETTGLIGFLADGSAVPAGYKPLLAAVSNVDLTTNGVEVEYEAQDYSILPTEDET